MWKVFFCLLVIGSCKNANQEAQIQFSELDKDDSLEVVCSILDSLEKEMYTQRIGVDQDTLLYSGCCLFMETRNSLNLKQNKNSQIVVQNEIVPFDSISTIISDYYLRNSMENDVTNNLPFYTRLNQKTIQKFIELRKKELLEIDKTDYELIEYQNHRIADWRQKLVALQTLNLEYLPEIHYQAKIHFTSQLGLKSHYKVRNEILRAIADLRNNASKQYFNESFYQLFYRFLNSKNHKDKIKLNALKQLFPVVLIDENNLKKYDLHIFNVSKEPILPVSI